MKRRIGKLLGRSAGLTLLATCLAAAPALAAPLTLWMASDFGLDAASVTAAQSAGVDLLPDSTFFGGGGITITTPPQIVGDSVLGATKSNPSTGESTWTVTAVNGSYQDLWIVIQGHDPNDPTGTYYGNSNVGLSIDTADARWALVHPAGYPQVTYLAYFVGDLAQDESEQIAIDYRVAQALYQVSGSSPLLCLFPQYRVNFLQLSVPEPALFALLGFAAVALASRKQRIAR